MRPLDNNFCAEDSTETPKVKTAKVKTPKVKQINGIWFVRQKSETPKVKNTASEALKVIGDSLLSHTPTGGYGFTMP